MRDHFFPLFPPPRPPPAARAREAEVSGRLAAGIAVVCQRVLKQLVRSPVNATPSIRIVFLIALFIERNLVIADCLCHVSCLSNLFHLSKALIDIPVDTPLFFRYRLMPASLISRLLWSRPIPVNSELRLLSFQDQIWKDCLKKRCRRLALDKPVEFLSRAA